MILCVCVCVRACFYVDKYGFVAFQLTKTLSQMLVRGMMYYRKALELQAFLDMARDEGNYYYLLVLAE